jgi:hypothetical protein
MWNLSCYHRGMMGNRTPNIDRIAIDQVMKQLQEGTGTGK